MKKTTIALLAFLLAASYSFRGVAQIKKTDTTVHKPVVVKKKHRPEGCCNSLKPCKLQSPINIYAEHAHRTTSDKYQFNFFSKEVFNPDIDPGHTKLVYNYTSGEHPTTVTLGTKTYRLNQIHMHNANEHIIDNKQHDFEIHMVYGNPDAKPLDLVVVGIVGDYKDHTNQMEFANQVCAAMKKAIDCKEHNPKEHCRQTIDVGSIIKSGAESGELNFPYYSYYGSLTTGSCATGVHWIVKQKPVTAEKIGLETEKYKNYFPGARRPQKFEDRGLQLVLEPRK